MIYIAAVMIDAQIQNLIIQHGYRTIPHWQHPYSNVTPINTC